MVTSPQDAFQQRIADLNLSQAASVPALVEAILVAAREHGVSDVHLIPRQHNLQMNWRRDGVLFEMTTFPNELKTNIVTRLKVLAELLTYQTDVPQEGRIRGFDAQTELRLSTFPTLFGEKAVVRLLTGPEEYRDLHALSYPTEIGDELRRLLRETSGVILVSGPAGSGKTTTIYTCLRQLIADSSVLKSIATLEDPIEGVIESAAQSQIKADRGFDYVTALKSLLRQDPEVILVGEIRDPETARLVFQAALTGHLVLSTFHAGSAAGAIARLLDMGLEPFQLRSGLLCVVNQRLVRKLCDCAIPGTDSADKLGLSVNSFQLAQGCETCAGSGYRGRVPLAEMLSLTEREIAEAVLSREDAHEIETRSKHNGMRTRWELALRFVETGVTTPVEIRRVLGFGDVGSQDH